LQAAPFFYLFGAISQGFWEKRFEPRKSLGSKSIPVEFEHLPRKRKTKSPSWLNRSRGAFHFERGGLFS
jgi:hypothetical protein